MSNKKLKKKVLLFSLSATMVFAIGSSAYANTSALPNGTITTQNGTKFLTDSKGEKYSGWFIDSKEDWYYFNESDKTMKKGWHHDEKDGYWYYLNPSDGKMVTGWQTIESKEYFFQPVRDMGNYHFNNEGEKWLYSINSKVPYGAMYVNTSTPDGSKVDSAGAKVVVETSTQTVNNNSSSDTDTVRNGWVPENGNWHYYENGALAKNKWLNLDGKWYYVLSDGAMVFNTWKEIASKTYYFGSDGAMYVNTTTPDGKKVNQEGIVIIEETKEINYANIFQGTFIRADGDEYEAYQRWIKNGKTTTDDGGYWIEIWLEANEFGVTSETGDSGHAFASGTINWTGSNTAILVDRHQNSPNSNLEVIDSNTILIDNEKYIKIK